MKIMPKKKSAAPVQVQVESSLFNTAIMRKSMTSEKLKEYCNFEESASLTLKGSIEFELYSGDETHSFLCLIANNHEFRTLLKTGWSITCNEKKPKSILLLNNLTTLSWKMRVRAQIELECSSIEEITCQRDLDDFI
ncbi:hypothetical protein ACOME3_001452 [Neoechinorhynchus agilis]